MTAVLRHMKFFNLIKATCTEAWLHVSGTILPLGMDFTFFKKNHFEEFGPHWCVLGCATSIA